MLKTAAFEKRFFPDLEALSPEKAEVLRFHGDVIPGSAVMVLRSPDGTPEEDLLRGGSFLGAGFLEAMQNYRVRKEEPGHAFYNVQMDFALDFRDSEAVTAMEMLLQALTERCAELKANEPEHPIALTYWVRLDARETRAFFERFGFREAYRCYRMARALSEENEDTEAEGTLTAAGDERITEMDLRDPAAMKRYIEGTREAYGVPDSEDEMRFRILRQGARVFTIEEKSFVTVWDLGHGDAATENVFTRKEFRREGLSKKLLEGVAEILRKEGQSRLLLNVYPKFAAPALRMYRSLGYKRLYTLLEMHKMF
ncbi:MAG: GNAT family N-acetyltransferase [Lachnospiraceae bacterium]|nr:GNAT family N-acetyltransferase [Lachnospiraceae bacterium]